MARFPALHVSAPRARELPSFPGETSRPTTGAAVVVRATGDAGPERLPLEFLGVTTAQLALIWGHYLAQQGSLYPFDLSAEVLEGLDNAATYTPAGYSWIYDPQVPIQVTDWSAGYHDVGLVLRMVPEVSGDPDGPGSVGSVNPEVTDGGYGSTAVVITVYPVIVAGGASSDGNTDPVSITVNPTVVVAGDGAAAGSGTKPVTMVIAPFIRAGGAVVGTDGGTTPVWVDVYPIVFTRGAQLTARTYWRIVDVTLPAGSAYLEVAEFQLHTSSGRAAGTLTSSDAPTAFTVANFDNDNLGDRCYWTAAVATSSGFWVRWEFGTPQLIEKVRIGTWSTTTNRYPSGFTLQASEDGTVWETYGSASGLVAPVAAQTYGDFIFPN